LIDFGDSSTHIHELLQIVLSADFLAHLCSLSEPLSTTIPQPDQQITPGEHTDIVWNVCV